MKKTGTSNKQASHGICERSDEALQVYTEALENIKRAYHSMLEMGVCREQARMILPLSMNSTAIWTCSLQALVNFIELRDHEHAQVEIRVYATKAKMYAYPLMYQCFFIMNSSNFVIGT